MIIQFWKNLQASINVNYLIQQIYSLTDECDVAFNYLLFENEDDKTLQKLYEEYQQGLNFT